MAKAKSTSRQATQGQATQGRSFAQIAVETIETLAVAVVFALFIKFFVVEAFRIPSSSMEPTLIGSGEISDKILVAKNHYLFFGEPARWDVAVFKYPNNRARAYIKRIVGMGGDWLLVRDGDVLDCAPDASGKLGTPRSFARPDQRVVDSMCHPLFPADTSLQAILHRGVVREQRISEWWQPAPPALATHFSFKEDSVAYAPASGSDPGAPVREWLRYSSFIDNSLDSSGGEVPPVDARVGVEDIQLGFAVTQPAAARIEGGVVTHKVDAGFVIDPIARKVELVVRDPNLSGDTALIAAHEAPLPATAAAALESAKSILVRFEHIDFNTRIFIDGELIAELSYPARRKDLDRKNIQVRFGASGAATFKELFLARDIFYSAPVKPATEHMLAAVGLVAPNAIPASDAPGVFVNHPFHVPPGHYVMMGDNSSNSADSRHWHLAGYLESDRTPRVWEDASYGLADGRSAAMDSSRFDIYGRVFKPDPANAMKDASGQPILLGYWLVDAELCIGFMTPAADGKQPEFIDLDGRARKYSSSQRLSTFVCTDRRGGSAPAGEAIGDSFTIVGMVEPKPNPDGSLGSLVASPGSPGGLRLEKIPAGFVVEEHPGLIWSPFVARDQLLGKGFCVFMPGGLWSGKIHGLRRFSYIR